MARVIAEAFQGLRVNPLMVALWLAVVGGCVALLATPYASFALLIGPGIAALLLLGRYPQVGLNFFIFLIPFEFIARLSPEQKEITLSKFFGLALVIVSLAMVLTGRWQARHLRSRFWPFILGFVVVNFLAFLNTDYPATAAAELRFIVTGAVIFALVLLLSNRRSFTSSIPTVLIWGVILNYVIFFLEFYFKITMPWLSSPIYSRDVSLPGYSLPTGYSTYLIFLLPFLAHRFFFSSGFPRKMLYVIMALLTVSGIVYLGSRVGFVVGLASLAMLSFQYARLLKPRLIGFAFGGALLAAAGTVMLLPGWYVDRQKTMTDTVTDSSVGMRVAFLRTGWDFFKQKPLLGYGPGTFRDEYANTLEALKFSKTYISHRMKAHNTYLEVLIGSGLLGLLFLLALIGVALRNYSVAAANFHRKGDVKQRLMASAFLAAFMVNLLLFFFVSSIDMKHFWIFLAMSEVARRTSEKGHFEESMPTDDAGAAVAPWRAA